MAPNDLKPNQSSSEEEEEEGSGSEDEYTSGSESEEILAPTQSAIKPQAPDPPSSESEESGSETESESDSDSPPKPIASKPMERDVPSKTTSTPPPAKSKRPPPSPATENNAKKSKKALIAASGSDKKPQAPDLSSSGEEESGSETDSDSDHIVKPEVGVNVESKLAKNGSKTTSPAPTVNEKDIKKPKANGEVKKPLIAPSAKKLQSSSEGEEESGSETDSDSSVKKVKKPAVVDAKPISSKPMEKESKLAKKEGTKAVTTPSKRPAGTVNEKDAKKAKTVAEDDTKRQLFQRLWGEDDEIVILEGVIEYKAEHNGANALSDIGAFHEFIKKSLHIEVSDSQVADKIRRLKKKYMTNVGKEEGGKGVSFSKSHDKKVYELSKLIWGGDSGKTVAKGKRNQSQKNGNVKGTPASTSAGLLKSNGVGGDEKSLTVVEKRMDISRFVQYGGMNGSPVLPDEIVKAGLELVDEPRRAELEEKWKKLMEQELVLYVKRMELLKEQAELVLEAIDSSGN